MAVTGDDGYVHQTDTASHCPDTAPPSRRWSWTLWEVEVPVPKLPAGSTFTVAAKATDDAHNTQPDSVAGVWNLRGLNNNAWHQVAVTVKDE